jgi:hypothetical protein
MVEDTLATEFSSLSFALTVQVIIPEFVRSSDRPPARRLASHHDFFDDSATENNSLQTAILQGVAAQPTSQFGMFVFGNRTSPPRCPVKRIRMPQD